MNFKIIINIFYSIDDTTSSLTIIFKNKFYTIYSLKKIFHNYSIKKIHTIIYN